MARVAHSLLSLPYADMGQLKADFHHVFAQHALKVTPQVSLCVRMALHTTLDLLKLGLRDLSPSNCLDRAGC